MKIIDNYFIKLFHNFTINPSLKTKSTILISNNNNKCPKQPKSIILKLNPVIYSVPLNHTDNQDKDYSANEYLKPESVIKTLIESTDKKIEETLERKMEQTQKEKTEEELLGTLEKVEDMKKEEVTVLTIVPQIIGNNLTYNIILDHIKKYHSLYFILGLILFIKHK